MLIIIKLMCRVINVVCSNVCGGNKFFADIAERLSLKGRKVCVFDFGFKLNEVSYMFKLIPQKDVKEYILGECFYKNALNKINSNLFIVKTSCRNFEYKKHLNEIASLIEKLQAEFDYLFIVGEFEFDEVGKFRLHSSTELILILSNEINSIRFSKYLLQAAWNFENIKSQKLILCDYKEFAAAKGKLFSKEKIEKILKCEILGIMPRFPSKKRRENILRFAALSVDENRAFLNNYKNSCGGLFGVFRRFVYARFE